MVLAVLVLIHFLRGQLQPILALAVITQVAVVVVDLLHQAALVVLVAVVQVALIQAAQKLLVQQVRQMLVLVVAVLLALSELLAQSQAVTVVQVL